MLYDITKFTQLDYPDKLACILWFAGCNFRCGYCYNPDIVFGEPHILEDEFFSFLKTRIGKLDAVVLSGGEPTLNKNIYDLCSKIKDLDFLIKLDTNGSNPKVISKLIESDLINMIALDFKAPQNKFAKITGVENWEEFSKSLDIINNSNISFEIRTTVHSEILIERDIFKIIDDLYSRKYKGIYYLQNFLKDKKTLSNTANQKRVLDINIIAKYAKNKVEIEFRNF